MIKIYKVGSVLVAGTSKVDAKSFFEDVLLSDIVLQKDFIVKVKKDKIFAIHKRVKTEVLFMTDLVKLDIMFDTTCLKDGIIKRNFSDSDTSLKSVLTSDVEYLRDTKTIVLS